MKSKNSLLDVFTSRKMATLLMLGFSSGLPLYLTGKDPMQAWLSSEGVDLKVIGFFSIVALPYSLKFLWSPFIDRYVPPFLGRRRGWLLVTQILLIITIALMGFQDPGALKTVPTAMTAATACAGSGFFQGLCEIRHTVGLMAGSSIFWFAMIVAFFSATQDIVADAYRTDSLTESERGAGASVFLFGYRIAIQIAGALTLAFAQVMPWKWVYFVMALLMSVGVVASLIAPEPEQDSLPPTSLVNSIVLPFQEFFQRSGWRRAVLILTFIVIYKLGDSLLRNVATPFLLDKGLGFSTAEIAFPKLVAFWATTMGVLCGGVIMTRIGVNKSLWIFAILQAVGNLTYVLLAIVGKSYPIMFAALNIENFLGGLEAAAFVALLMSLCNVGLSATQYALFSSLQAFSRDILTAPAGVWAEQMGWVPFFTMTAIVALPGILLLPFFAPWNEKTVES